MNSMHIKTPKSSDEIFHRRILPAFSWKKRNVGPARAHPHLLVNKLGKLTKNKTISLGTQILQDVMVMPHRHYAIDV